MLPFFQAKSDSSLIREADLASLTLPSRRSVDMVALSASAFPSLLKTDRMSNGNFSQHAQYSWLIGMYGEGLLTILHLKMTIVGPTTWTRRDDLTDARFFSGEGYL
jgi:hypothetical protein